MIRIKGYTDKVAHAVIIPVTDKAVHLFRMAFLTIDTDIDILIVIE